MIDEVMQYAPVTEREARSKEEILELLRTKMPQALQRDHFDGGHMTGSGVLISADGTRVLMNYHKALQTWLNFGGHADGEADMMDVAMRETIEESGIAHIELASDDILSVDVHVIPANKKRPEPEHNHYDVRYLFRVLAPEYEAFEISDESESLRWCTYEEALELPILDEMRDLLKLWGDRI